MPGYLAKRHVVVFFRPKAWAQDPEHVRYLTIECDQTPSEDDLETMVDKACPAKFREVMDVIGFRRFDAYGQMGKDSPKLKKLVSKAKEWEDDGVLHPRYSV